MLLLIAINTIVFLSLSILHFYWAFGGRWGWESTLPTKSDGQFLFKPSLAVTLVVAFGLLLFAAITVGNSGVLNDQIDRKYIHQGTWVIAIIFLLRAIGDFNNVGFSKKFNNSRFAHNDTKIYSPLCLGLSIFSFLIALVN